ncbi:hypothetical protein AVEN_34212-1 [Araneus ventricosus]|uniref:Uncharacterized protein n=1 Tax=Araneus ventricosus TaxID=182803 RepID=A0A4Y2S6U9_ARAVE|nr:hypothetical protein AVEN_34212-1 [Araneus ventricosus]
MNPIWVGTAVLFQVEAKLLQMGSWSSSPAVRKKNDALRDSFIHTTFFQSPTVQSRSSLHQFNRGQMTKTTPELQPSSKKIPHHTSVRTFAPYVSFNVHEARIHTADLQWSRVSNLEPSSPVVESLSLGHRGPMQSKVIQVA